MLEVIGVIFVVIIGLVCFIVFLGFRANTKFSRLAIEKIRENMADYGVDERSAVGSVPEMMSVWHNSLRMLLVSMQIPLTSVQHNDRMQIICFAVCDCMRRGGDLKKEVPEYIENHLKMRMHVMDSPDLYKKF